jgi:hypothetical protein
MRIAVTIVAMVLGASSAERTNAGQAWNVATPSQARVANPAKQSKLSQANPNRIAWFYSSESGLINGLQRFQIRILSALALPCRQRASPGAPWFSDYCDDVGRILIFARWEAKDCGVSLIRLGLPGAASAEPTLGVKPRVALRALTGREIFSKPSSKPNQQLTQ